MLVSTFGGRLRDARKKKGFTQKQLADAIGVKHNSVSNWENDQNRPDPDLIELILGVLEISADKLLGNRRNNDSEPDVILSPDAKRIGCAYDRATHPVKRTVEVALEPFMEVDDDPPDNIISVDFNHSEQRASAGRGIFLDDESMITIAVCADALPADYQRNPGRYFGVPVGGNSMEPRFYHDDLLIVSKEPVNVGEIGIFTMEGEGYVKVLGRGVLHSLNPNYDDIPLTEDILCNGKVIGVLDPASISDDT